jgi:DNA invertase Pin-like site-specific DNA recombinase
VVQPAFLRQAAVTAVPADFNDGLLLGLKAQMSQAELHFLRARLQGGKVNKAKKGELRFPLPVGLCYDDANAIVLDPDAEVRGAVELLLSIFRERGSGYAVAQELAGRGRVTSRPGKSQCCGR